MVGNVLALEVEMGTELSCVVLVGALYIPEGGVWRLMLYKNQV